MDVLIYCRFWTEMQNPWSCDDQARAVKAGLARFGIDAEKPVVIKDSAVSGTKVKREGFDKILARIRPDHAFSLAVDDQSRLSRKALHFPCLGLRGANLSPSLGPYCVMSFPSTHEVPQTL